MESTTEDEDVNDGHGNLSKTFIPLKSLERVGSSESVQLWIDSLTDDDWKNSSDDKAGFQKHFKADQGNAELLSLPGTGDDDLMLGADAKSLSAEESERGFSPRLSPLLFDNSENNLHFSDNAVSCFENMREKQVDEDNPHIEDSRTSSNDGQSNLLLGKPEHRGVVNETEEPLRSFPSVSSVFAAMETDPEDMLISLGFCDDISSQIRRIPPRFFVNPSQARGIDVQDFFCRFMSTDSQDIATNAGALRRGSLSTRFSESSIDLSLVDYGDDIFTKFRRSKFKETSIPSITVSDEDLDDNIAAEKNDQARSSGHLRLSTVVEECEPRSRASSMSRSFSGEKRALQKQERVDIREDNETYVSVFHSIDSDKDENQVLCTTSSMENKNLQENKKVLYDIIEHRMKDESDLVSSDSNNNFNASHLNVEYLQNTATVCFAKDSEKRPKLECLHQDNTYKLRGMMELRNDERRPDVDCDSCSCKEEIDVDRPAVKGGEPKVDGGAPALGGGAPALDGGSPALEGDADVEILRDSESGKFLTESESSFPDSIEDGITRCRGSLQKVSIERQIILRQFSNDSLQDSLSEHSSRHDSVDGCEIEHTISDKCSLEENFSDTAPSRIVYRSLGKIENLIDNNGRTKRTEETPITGSLGYCKSKTERSFTSYLPFLTNGSRSKSTPSNDFSRSCFVESAPTKDSSMTIKDYFRKLANGKRRKFFSLESLNTIGDTESIHGDALFPNNSATTAPYKATDDDDESEHSSLPFRKHSDYGIGTYKKPISGNGKQLKAFLNLDFFSLKSSENSEVIGRKTSGLKGFENSRNNSGRKDKLGDEDPLEPKNDETFPRIHGHSLGVDLDLELERGQSKELFFTGCSVESSGFEDENGICKSPLERGCRSAQRTDSKYHSQCEDCLHADREHATSDASFSNSTQADSSCLNAITISKSHQTSDTDLMKDRFDYLVLQIASLREELSDREERLKRYIDESMENIKTSILTEISILHASRTRQDHPIYHS